MNEELKRQNNLREAIKFVLSWEGEYSDDPSDPGGETKWGISKKSYPDEDIKNLSRQRALDIYVKDYWIPAGCDDIPFPYNVAVFDTAVHCGVDRARAWVRESKHVKEFLDKRRDYYVDIINKNNTLIRFARGWWNRLIDLNKYVAINGGFDSLLGRSGNPESPA